MSAKAPGRNHRESISLFRLTEMFPNEESARRWFEARMWPSGRHCPRCGSTRTHDATHARMPYRCTDCRSYFSVRTGTAIERSKIPLRKWVFAIYLEMTALKGVSSMKLHRDIDVSQKTAWFMLHRIRQGLVREGEDPFTDSVEVDETYVGGRKKPGIPGRGAVGKAVVAGTKERKSKRIRARVIRDIKKTTLHEFVAETVDPTATVYTDELRSYQGIPNPHETVCHSARQYVDGMASTNGIESFWATLKKAYHGTYHWVSHKHLDRYVAQFVGKHNMRDLATVEQMGSVAAGMVGRKITYRELVTAA